MTIFITSLNLLYAQHNSNYNCSCIHQKYNSQISKFLSFLHVQRLDLKYYCQEKKTLSIVVLIISMYVFTYYII